MQTVVKNIFLFLLCFTGTVWANEELVVGMETGYPPFESIDQDGAIVGFDVDVARLIAEKLGKKAVLKDMDFDSEILALQQGKIDLIISGMNITSARQRVIHMVPYHGTQAQSLSLIFWSAPSVSVKTLQDLESFPNATVSVGVGTVSEQYLALFPQIQARAFQGALAPLLDVKYGKSIATLVESDVAGYLHSHHPTTHVVEIPIEKGRINGFGIGIKKENIKRIEEVQRIIGELQDSEELKAVEQKWFGEGV